MHSIGCQRIGIALSMLLGAAGAVPPAHAGARLEIVQGRPFLRMAVQFQGPDQADRPADARRGFDPARAQRFEERRKAREAAQAASAPVPGQPVDPAAAASREDRRKHWQQLTPEERRELRRQIHETSRDQNLRWPGKPEGERR
jgi:hypothetical protein